MLHSHLKTTITKPTTAVQSDLTTYLCSHEGKDVDTGVDITHKDREKQKEGTAGLYDCQQHQDLDVEGQRDCGGEGELKRNNVCGISIHNNIHCSFHVNLDPKTLFHPIKTPLYFP